MSPKIVIIMPLLLMLLILAGSLPAAEAPVNPKADLDPMPVSHIDAGEPAEAGDSAAVDSISPSARLRAPGTDTSAADLDTTTKIKRPWPTGALLRSAILPGWGQLYNKSYLKALIYGGAEIAFAYQTRQFWREMAKHQKNFQNSDDPVYQAEEFQIYKDKRDTRNLYLWLTGLTIFVSMFDAYVDAHMAAINQPDKVFEVYVSPDKERVEITLTYNFR